MHQPKQLQLFDFAARPEIKVIHDSYWDELEAQTSDVVEQASLSINTENEILDIGTELAHQQNAHVGEQVPTLSYLYKSGVSK
jgi:hypothetical protein